jgi:hypothetical protein
MLDNGRGDQGSGIAPAQSPYMWGQPDRAGVASPPAGTRAVPRSRTHERGFCHCTAMIDIAPVREPQPCKALIPVAPVRKLAHCEAMDPLTPGESPCMRGQPDRAGTRAVPRSRPQERGFSSLQRHDHEFHNSYFRIAQHAHPKISAQETRCTNPCYRVSLL